MRIARTVAAVLLVSTAANAHDFWVEPERFLVPPDSVLSARLFIGHTDEREAYARNPEHIARFEAVGPTESRPLVERAGQDPAGRARLAEEGAHWLVYHSRPSSIVLEAEAFEGYLGEEGLERVIAARAERGESEAPARESYTRCAKALVRVGETGGGHDRVVGLPVELTPAVDPAAGTDFTVLLTVRGEPLAGALVEAQALDGGGDFPRARTDEHGRARFELPRPGGWLFAAVHMERAPAGAPEDWRSWWASLALEVGGGPGPSEETSQFR